MPLIYAVEVSFVPNYVHLEGVKRHLIFIECDRCERRVKPRLRGTRGLDEGWHHRGRAQR